MLHCGPTDQTRTYIMCSQHTAYRLQRTTTKDILLVHSIHTQIAHDINWFAACGLLSTNSTCSLYHMHTTPGAPPPPLGQARAPLCLSCASTCTYTTPPPPSPLCKQVPSRPSLVQASAILPCASTCTPSGSCPFPTDRSSVAALTQIHQERHPTVLVNCCSIWQHFWLLANQNDLYPKTVVSAAASAACFWLQPRTT
jgi:hypothetical protein